jgi:site-specific DNA-methyltransferase (adenine-specific)
MTWELRLGDCLDPVTGLASLADKSVDHVICDPPYSEHVHRKVWVGAALTSAGSPRCGTAHKAIGFDALSVDVATAVMDHVQRISRRWALVFCDLEGIGLWVSLAGDTHVRVCVWDKVDSAPQFTGDRPANSAEAICCSHPSGRKRWNGGGNRNVYRVPMNGGTGAKSHPTQKPVGLMERLIADFTNPGDLICDPFAGSGTTGVAAIRHGRRFIGWEKDAKYHATATARLADVREQLAFAL